MFIFSFNYLNVSQTGVMEQFFVLLPQFDFFCNLYSYNSYFWYYASYYRYEAPYLSVLLQNYSLMAVVYVYIFSDLYTHI